MDGDNGFSNSVKISQAQIAVSGVRSAAPARTGDSSSFSDIFNKKVSDSLKISFSRHASQRLGARNITLTESQLDRVEDGVTQAAQKGIKDSLVMVDDVCLVVNVKNKTVVTAMPKNIGDSIFTNIDGAVIV